MEYLWRRYSIVSNELKLAPARLLLLASCLLLACFVLNVPQAFAATGLGFRVSPTYINPTIAVGDETREAVTLQNSSKYQITVNARVGPSDQSKAVITLDQEQVTLRPGDSAVVYVGILAPDDAVPGNWQQTILFDAAHTAGADVSIVGRVSMMLDLTVINSVEDVKWSFPRLVDSTEEVSFDASGRNAGNFTTRLEEKVDLAGPVTGDINLVSKSDPITVGESAKLQAVWTESPLFSVKRATLTIGSGVGKPIRSEALIVVFPWKLSLMLGLMVLTAATGAWFQRFFAKVLADNGRKRTRRNVAK